MLCFARGCALRAVALSVLLRGCAAVFDGVRGQASTVASKAGVWQAEVRGDGAVAGHVVGVETNLLCDAEGDAVVDARADEKLALADQLAQHRQQWGPRVFGLSLETSRALPGTAVLEANT